MSELGDAIVDILAELGSGGGVDVPDCVVGSLCAQADIEAAEFIKNVRANYPDKLKTIGAKLQIVKKKSGVSYGYLIGVDANGIVHEYKGTPIEKILNIWNYGTGDGKIDRTRFWSKAVRKLKGKYDRATDRFFDILDKRYSGYLSHAKNSGSNVSSKMAAYERHKGEYMNELELSEVSVLQNSEVEI